MEEDALKLMKLMNKDYYKYKIVSSLIVVLRKMIMDSFLYIQLME
jgi:hypothetical protein